MGIGVQKLFAISASRTINASESGLGTAAIFMVIQVVPNRTMMD